MGDLPRRLAVREALLDCTSCELHARAKGPVPFSGPTPAHVAIVGEAPGRQEDAQGQPMVGPAGSLLRKALIDAGIDPAWCLFCNTVSCWPDATPTRAHVHACATNLMSQLELGDPSWILAVGNVALSVVRPELKVTRARGHVFWPNGTGNPPGWFITFHPSAALRLGKTETAMRADITTFAAMVAAPDTVSEHGTELAGWVPYASGDCLGCGITTEEMEDHDLEWMLDAMGGTYCSSCYPQSPEAKGETKVMAAIERVQDRTGKLFR